MHSDFSFEMERMMEDSIKLDVGEVDSVDCQWMFESPDYAKYWVLTLSMLNLQVLLSRLVKYINVYLLN